MTVSATGDQYLNEVLPVGVYTFTVTGTDAAGNSETETFTWTLIEPCSKTTNSNYQLTVDDFDPADYQYTITDDAFSISLPSITVEPSFCPYTVDGGW